MEDFTANSGQNTGQPSGQSSKRPAGQNLGIAALITAIVTFVFAVIPCVGLIAIIPGIIAIVLASVGLSQASKADTPRGVLVAGLIIAVVAVAISFSQIFVAEKISNRFHDKWGGEIENVVKDVQKNVLDELDNASVSIKVESNGEKVEINTSVNKDDREKQLEELEKANAATNDTLKKKK